MKHKPHPCLPAGPARVNGIIREPEPVRLPPDHPCHGCIQCNTEGTVPLCPFFTCKREEYEKLWENTGKDVCND